MGLLGGGDESSLASSSGWGVQPPPSSSDWGSSANNNNSSNGSAGSNSSSNNNNNNNNSAASSNWASSGSCGSGAAVSAAMAINSSGSNQQSSNGGLRSSQQQSSLNSNQANLLMSSNQAGDQQQQSLLSSSPKPALSSSWAQAAGKGLVHATSTNAGIASGPNTSLTVSSNSSAGIITTNSHDTLNVGSGSGGSLGLGTASLQQSCSSQQQQQQQQQSSVASSCLSASSVATTANSSSGGLSMGGNVVSSTLAFAGNGSSSNGNGNNSGASAGLNMLGGSNASGSSGNAMDAANAAANKRQIGSSSSTTSGINDLIGGLSDDFRETLFTEKWGSSVINQDSPWNLPSSSHASSSSPKVHQDTSTWRCPVNSGTEIWESSIRQKKGSLGGPGGGLLSSASVGMGGGPVQPWGQTPTTNIGGTWGEDEGIDTSNHWTGVPQSTSLNSVTSVGGNMGPTGGPSLGHSALGGHVNSSSINPNWSAGPSALSNGGPGSGISNSYSLLNPSGLGAGGLGANSMGGDGAPGMNNWNGNDKSAYDSRKATNWGNFDQSDSVSESNWDKSGNDGGAFGTWNPPDNRKDGCWDKDSNDSFKGVDDGTAVWGNPGGRSAGNSSQHGPLRQPQPPNWKDQQQSKYGMPLSAVNKNGYTGNPGWNGNNGGNKPLNQSMLTRPSWNEANSGHRKSPSMWNDDNKSMNGSMTPNWSDGQIDTSSWGSSKPAKPLTREMILSSKQYRLLVDLGHKKDDAENALRNCGGRFEDALAHLETVKPIKSGFGSGGNNPLMDFNKMTLSGAGNGNGRGHGGLAPMPPNAGASACPPASLHNLAQRIHLAVSTGFLNPAILNQPLSNQNLEILSELLNQIKLLKEVQGQMQQSNGSLKSSLEYRLRDVRQNIAQLQNQLRTDAGAKMTNNGMGKDFFEPNNDGPMNKEMFQLSKGPVDSYGGNGNAGGHTGGGGLQGSRLFNWKHSKQSVGEHGGPMGTDFIRAPGGLPKPNPSATNWSNFSDDNGGGWPDKTGVGDHMAAGGGLDCDYGGLSNFGAPMAPDTFDSGYGKQSWKPAAKSALVDDDPRSPISQKTMMNDNSFSWNSGLGGASTNAISKGSNSLLGGGGGQAAQMDSLNSPFGFSGNPWSYNSGPASSSAGNAAMGVNATPFSAGDLNKNKNAMNKPNNPHTWSNSGLNSSDYTDSLWTSGGGNNGGNGNNGPAGAGKPRPPPGLSKSGSATSGGNSIWSSGGSGSEFLRLRNLTPQIDGSTLKTLCCQHGPLNQFLLFLNHGAAIAQYSNREQAIKAQSALNNCVLGNTTILADLPLQSEVQQYLQLISGGGHSANPNGSGGQSANNAGGANGAGPHNAHNSSGQQSHGGHHGGSGHHSGYGNPTTSWSNGTNASQSNAGSGAGIQSNAAPSTAPIPLYSRTSSVGAASSGPNSAPITVAHMSPFASSSAVVNQLPYNSGAPGLVSSHSNYNNSVLNQAAVSAVNSANQFSKMDNGLLSSWNTASSGSGGLWDSSALPGASGGLWSTGGYGAADRNTPIQNYLPGDLLTGDNN